jgi:hypothetical protein
MRPLSYGLQLQNLWINTVVQRQFFASLAIRMIENLMSFSLFMVAAMAPATLQLWSEHDVHSQWNRIKLTTKCEDLDWNFKTSIEISNKEFFKNRKDIELLELIL